MTDVIHSEIVDYVCDVTSLPFEDSQFDVDIGSNSKTYYAGGPQVGGSIETRLSKVDPNLSLRIEYVYTDYLTADILGSAGQVMTGAGTGGVDNTITGHDSAGRIGVQYSF